MLPNDRAQPAIQDKPGMPARIMRWVGRRPLISRLVLLVLLSPFIFFYALGFANHLTMAALVPAFLWLTFARIRRGSRLRW